MPTGDEARPPKGRETMPSISTSDPMSPARVAGNVQDLGQHTTTHEPTTNEMLNVAICTNPSSQRLRREEHLGEKAGRGNGGCDIRRRGQPDDRGPSTPFRRTRETSPAIRPAGRAWAPPESRTPRQVGWKPPKIPAPYAAAVRPPRCERIARPPTSRPRFLCRWKNLAQEQLPIRACECHPDVAERHPGKGEQKHALGTEPVDEVSTRKLHARVSGENAGRQQPGQCLLNPNSRISAGCQRRMIGVIGRIGESDDAAADHGDSLFVRRTIPRVLPHSKLENPAARSWLGSLQFWDALRLE